MLGLERHAIRLVEHDPEWTRAFDSEAAAIRRCLGDRVAGVEHVGSTAVPGMVAKPILDIALAVRSGRELPEVVRRLGAIGFIDRGDAGTQGGYLLVKDVVPGVRIVHVHVVDLDDPQWRAYTTFRDGLRKDPRLRDEYIALKQRLAEAHRADREAYTSGKAGFIAETLKRLLRGRVFMILAALL